MPDVDRSILSTPTPYDVVSEPAHRLSELQAIFNQFSQLGADLKTTAHHLQTKWTQIHDAFLRNSLGYESMQQFILESTLQRVHLRLIVETCEEKHYKELSRAKKEYINKLISLKYLGNHMYHGWWALYFWFGREIVQSIDALKILIKIGKAVIKCRREVTFTYESVHAQLVLAKGVRRYSHRRGVSRNIDVFALVDMRQVGREWDATIQELKLKSPPSPEIARGTSTHEERQHYHGHDEFDDGSFHTQTNDNLQRENEALEDAVDYGMFEDGEYGDAQRMMADSGSEGVFGDIEDAAESMNGDFDRLTTDDENDHRSSTVYAKISHGDEDSFCLLAQLSQDISATDTPIAGTSVAENSVVDTQIADNPAKPQLPAIATPTSEKDGQCILITPEGVSSNQEKPSPSVPEDAAAAYQYVKTYLQSGDKWTDYILQYVLESFKYPETTHLLHPLAISYGNLTVRDFYKYDTIFLPINHGSPGTCPHWTLAVVKPQKSSWEHYDSVRSTERAAQCSDVLFAWLQRQIAYNEGNMSYPSPSGTSPECVQQSDASSCGLFVATLVYRILNMDNGHDSSSLSSPIHVKRMQKLFIEGLDANQIPPGPLPSRSDLIMPTLIQTAWPEIDSLPPVDRLAKDSNVAKNFIIDSTSSPISAGQISLDAVLASIESTKSLCDKFRDQERAKRKLLDIEREEEIMERHKIEEEILILRERWQSANVEDAAIQSEEKNINDLQQSFLEWENKMPDNMQQFKECLTEISNQINQRRSSYEARKKENDMVMGTIRESLDENIVKRRRLDLCVKDRDGILKKQADMREKMEKSLKALCG